MQGEYNLRKNPSFWKALHCLHHPLTIASVLLLLFNDHWLRHHHPSWLTGKLGDFTWLIFAPFITAMLMSVIFRQWSQKRIGFLSFAFIGLWFATAKTIPEIHHLTTTILHAIIGWEGTLRIDPTDLITLPALFIGWHIWQKADDSQVNLRPIAVVMFGLGILGTLASTDGPIYTTFDNGVELICQQDETLFTITSDGAAYVDGTYNEETQEWEHDVAEVINVFTSDDGGLTWQHEFVENYVLSTDNCSSYENETITNIETNHIYRWIAGDRIEQSKDGGQSWEIVHNLPEFEQEVRQFLNHKTTVGYSHTVRHYPSPVSAWYHVESGNILFAMSQDGILLLDPNDNWHWVRVGDYQLANLEQFEVFNRVTFFERWQAGALAFLIITTTVAYMRRFEIHFRWALLPFSWLSWMIINFMMLNDSYEAVQLTSKLDGMIAISSFLALVFLAIPLSIAALWGIIRNFRPIIKHLIITAPIPAVLYLLPFLLWSQGTIPPYATAFAFAMGLAFIGTFAASMYLRRVLPTIEKPKKKNEEKHKQHS